MSYGRVFTAAVERARHATTVGVVSIEQRQAEILGDALQGLTVPQMRALYVAHYSGAPLPRGYRRAEVVKALQAKALASLAAPVE